MKLFVAVLVCLATVYGATIPVEDAPIEVDDITLPEGTITCFEDDPDLGKCLRDSITAMLPKLNNGDKDLNIPPLDPFTVERAQMQYGNGPIQGAFKIKNMRTYGMSQGEVRDVRMKIENDIVKTELDLYFPKIFMEGAYKADVKFNELKLHPKGRFNATMTKIDLTHHWAGHLVSKNGHKYLHIDDFDMIPDVEDMKIYVEGIFPDPQMNEIANNFLNQYWVPLYKMLLPETRNYWKPVMIDAINEFLQRVPFDILVKKRE